MTERQLIDESRREFSCFNVVQLATARAAELAEFEASVNVLTVRAKSGLQHLPVRLRRRAASHKINRLPRRLHRHSTANVDTSMDKNQFGVKKRTKLKSRRYRRRHLRLLTLAARSAPFCARNTSDRSAQCKPAWLPTHLWHAKRFHMVTRWGWRLPHAPTDKVFKACQAAAKNGCLLIDMSYLACLSVEGGEPDIVRLVQQIFKPEMTSESQALEACDIRTPGLATELCGFLFSAPTDPEMIDAFHLAHRTLGPARLLWSPKDWPRPGYRCIYFWVHPAMATETRHLLDECAEKFKSSQNCAVPVVVQDLTGQFCRLRLLGRQSHRLLGDILNPSTSDYSDSDWTVWSYFCETLHQASLVPSGTVLSLRGCADFRSNRPALKIRDRNWVAIGPTESCTLASPVRSSSEMNVDIYSALHDSDRKRRPGTWIVMPGAETHSTTHADRSIGKPTGVDILLIRNGCLGLWREYPHTIGWDIVLSRSGFPADDQPALRGSLAARDLLIACVYRGAEVGGQRDLYRWATIGTHGRGYMDAFPSFLWPDTNAGQTSETEATNSRLTRHNRLPPKLRPDYTRLGTEHPFSLPWDELLAEHCHQTYVIPDQLPCSLLVLRSAVFLECFVRPLMQGNKDVLKKLEQLTARFALLTRCLLMVHIQSVRRGVPKPCAVLFAPRDETDLRKHEMPLDTCPNDIRQSSGTNSGRIVLGYVQEGDYDYSTGQGTGLGFISLSALIRAAKRPQFQKLHNGFSRVLMKNVKSVCIRTVQLSLSPCSTP